MYTKSELEGAHHARDAAVPAGAQVLLQGRRDDRVDTRVRRGRDLTALEQWRDRGLHAGAKLHHIVSLPRGHGCHDARGGGQEQVR